MKISLYIAATLSLASLGALAQSNRTNVELNGRRIALRTVQPMQAGRDKLIPLRPLIARMGGRIQWERDTNTIVVSTKNERSARIYPGKNFVQANGVNLSLNAAPQIINGQTMVPVDFFQKALGLYTEENLETGGITLRAGTQNGENEIKVLRGRRGNQARLRRADIDAYNRNRILSNANYRLWLQQQDYNLYLNERAAWEQAHQNYLTNVASSQVVLQGYPIVPALSPYDLYLFNQDMIQFLADRALWQRNYQAFLALLNQNDGTLTNEALANAAAWQEYLQARNDLIQQLQNNPPR